MPEKRFKNQETKQNRFSRKYFKMQYDQRAMLSLDYIFGILIAVVVSFIVIAMVYSFYNNGRFISVFPIGGGHSHFVNTVRSVGSCDELNNSLQNSIFKCYEYIINSNNNSEGMSIFKDGAYCGSVEYVKSQSNGRCDSSTKNRILLGLKNNLKKKNMDWDIFIKAKSSDHKFIIIFNGQSFVIY